MDLEKLVGAVNEKHRIRLDPADPVFVLATIADLMIAEGRADMAKAVIGVADQISAASIQAETAAKGRAEAIVTKAGEWAADRIREAADRAGQKVEGAVDGRIAALQTAVRTMIYVSVVTTVCSVSLLGVTVILLLR